MRAAPVVIGAVIGAVVAVVVAAQVAPRLTSVEAGLTPTKYLPSSGGSL